MASFNAVYNGSRSILVGITTDLDTLGALDTKEAIDFGGNIGVVDISGLLSAAGSMSGIFGVAPVAACTARLANCSRAHEKRSTRGVWQCSMVMLRQVPLAWWMTWIASYLGIWSSDVNLANRRVEPLA